MEESRRKMQANLCLTAALVGKNGKKPFRYWNIPIFILSLSAKSLRGVAQSGSASALGAEGRRFESCHPDQINNHQKVVVFVFMDSIIYVSSRHGTIDTHSKQNIWIPSRLHVSTDKRGMGKCKSLDIPKWNINMGRYSQIAARFHRAE